MIRIICGEYKNSVNPRFSWKLQGDEGQKTYRILVLDRNEKIVWDSTTVESEKRHNIPCGVQLSADEKYRWKVNVQGSEGQEAHFESEWFYTGNTKWTAKWAEPDRTRRPLTDSTEPVEPIGRTERPNDYLDRLDAAVYMRQTIEIEKAPAFALLHVTAHGIYRLWVNGVCVSDLLAPGYTSYDKRLEYQTCDVTGLLKPGKNVIAAILADGWYTGKIGAVGIGWQHGTESALLMQINCRDEEGRMTSYGSDETAKWDTGAIRYADLFVGEYYDAEEEKEGWLSGEYADESWKPVRIQDFGYENLTPQAIPPVRELRTITPRVVEAPNGDLLLDAGENIVGFVSFKIDMKKGDVISLEHSETVDAEGNYLQNIIGQNKNQTDYYRCAKDGVNQWQPGFTFHGFRYVRVSGTTDKTPEHYQIHVIGTPLRRTGEFSCSDERLNRLQENIFRSQEGNMLWIPTDCPQRERVGWTGDIQVYARTGCLEQDLEQFLRHWLADMRNEQLADGQIPHIIPYMKSHDIMKPKGVKGVSAAGWSDAAVLIPWRLYEAYGDEEILKENFQMMKRYMEATERMANELPENYEELPEERKKYQKYLWNTGFQFGDWLMPSILMSGRPIFEVPKETGHVVATLLYIITTSAMKEICHILKEYELEAHYAELNSRIKEAFAVEYINADGTMTKEYQGVYVLALQTGAVPENLREAALSRLVELIGENNNRLDTGFLSVQYLLPVLHENGRADIANMLLFRDECPSWLYEVKMGATTIWEYWNGYAPDGTPSDCSMNHFAYGCVGEYFFRTILGIRTELPGYQKIRIQPDTGCGLTYAKGSYESIWGRIEVEWHNTDGNLSLEVVLPPDVEAEICLADKTKICKNSQIHIEAKEK